MDSLETSSPLSKNSCLTLLLIFTFVHVHIYTHARARASINEYEIEKRNVNFPGIKFTLVLRKKCTLLLHYPSDLLETAFWNRFYMSPVIGIPLWYIKSCLRTLISYASKLSASLKVHDDECNVVEPAPGRNTPSPEINKFISQPAVKEAYNSWRFVVSKIGSYRRAVKDFYRSMINWRYPFNGECAV